MGQTAFNTARPCASVMTKDVVTVAPDEMIEDAILLMEKLGISFLPVRNEFGGVQGVLTDRELAEHPPGVPVKDVMSKDVLTCWNDDDIDLAVDRMRARGSSRILVLDQTRRLVGGITGSDLARAALVAL